MLRGAGTVHIDSASIDGNGGAVFSDTWIGVVDSDVTPPSGSITNVKLARPGKPVGLWRARVSFVGSDDLPGNTVTYQAQATAGSFFALRSGTLASGVGSFRFAFRRERSLRVLQIEIVLRDPVVNETSLERKVELR
jgi:hypothetical protein